VSITFGLAALIAFGAAQSGAAPAPGPTSPSIPASTITVSAASSLTDVLPVIATAFEKRYPQIDVRFNFGGSPALVEQIRAGAPADVLATASEATMGKAVSAGLVGRPLLFAKNTMMIATPPGNPARVKSLADLPKVSVALCEVAVPCGTEARDLFAKNGITVTPVTRELDVRAVLGKVMADQVDAGIVYVTDVKSVGSKVTGVAIPANQNVTTTYPIATVRESSQQAAAKAFVDYVRFTPSAQGILRAWGFARP
jgi:molybdate transport system substrate-binding protein